MIVQMHIVISFKARFARHLFCIPPIVLIVTNDCAIG
jgi:hypothetical protein